MNGLSHFPLLWRKASPKDNTYTYTQHKLHRSTLSQRVCCRTHLYGGGSAPGSASLHDHFGVEYNQQRGWRLVEQRRGVPHATQATNSQPRVEVTAGVAAMDLPAIRRSRRPPAGHAASWLCSFWGRFAYSPGGALNRGLIRGGATPPFFSNYRWSHLVTCVLIYSVEDRAIQVAVWENL